MCRLRDVDLKVATVTLDLEHCNTQKQHKQKQTSVLQTYMHALHDGDTIALQSEGYNKHCTKRQQSMTRIE
jgi:hypothetical protein